VVQSRDERRERCVADYVKAAVKISASDADSGS
jgi:hypothetical protein